MYSWSIYNAPIDKYIYGDAKAGYAVNTFYIAVALLGCTAAILGPWLERNGPRRGLFLGVSMFLIGYIIAAISIKAKSIVGVYIGYGFFTGFGLGINYISPVSALQKWFPDMRGTAAGFAVGGFGAGSIVWGKVYIPAINAFGLPGSFIFLGCIMSGVMFTCALVMRTPPPGFTAGGMNIHGVVEHEDSKLLDDSKLHTPK
ncbi:Major Facilitator Superfamily (MFS), partial [Thraustotheca clavata]